MQPGNQIIFESIIQATMRYIYIYIYLMNWKDFITKQKGYKEGKIDSSLIKIQNKEAHRP